MTFAEKLKSLRTDKGVSLQTVADATGVTKPHIWELEKGKTKNPTLALAVKLANYFNVNIGYLAGAEDKEVVCPLSPVFSDLANAGYTEAEYEQIKRGIDMAVALVEKNRGL